MTGMEMTRRLTSPLGLGLAVVSLAACGSSSSTTTTQAQGKVVPKPELIAKGDAICAKNSNKLPPPNFNPAHATRAQLKAAARYFTGNAVEARADLTQTKAIGEPAQDRALFDQGLTELDALASDFDAAAAAARKGDIKTFEAALGKVGTNSAGRTAAQFGFKVCGH
jgi:hypothetical protein